MSQLNQVSAVSVTESLSYAPDPTGMYAVIARLAQRLNTMEALLEDIGRREVSPTATAATANTVMLRDGSGNATATLLNASGITFPASPITAPNARTITAFEEGDWTPTWLGTTTNPTVTYTTQQGHYLRVGGMVIFTGHISISAVTVAGTGNLRLGGLPFTISANQGYRGSMFFGYAFGFTAPAPMAGIPVASSTQVGLFGYNSTDARTDRGTFALASSLTATSSVYFSGVYAV